MIFFANSLLWFLNFYFYSKSKEFKPCFTAINLWTQRALQMVQIEPGRYKNSNKKKKEVTRATYLINFISFCLSSQFIILRHGTFLWVCITCRTSIIRINISYKGKKTNEMKQWDAHKRRMSVGGGNNSGTICQQIKISSNKSSESGKRQNGPMLNADAFEKFFYALFVWYYVVAGSDYSERSWERMGA